MAGFRVHVTTSALLGCGYAGAGYYAVHGLAPETAIVGGALCGFSGMLPDLDSDFGVPLREAMAFTAAIVPMLLVDRFQSLLLNYDEMVLAAVSLYLFVRFGLTRMIRRSTVHRGMFHSIPAGLIFAGVAFLVCGANDFPVRVYKAGGVFAGFMSHLIMDEIYAVEWQRGRWRFKKSFGTAIKFWGDDAWGNFSTYSKLIVVLVLILGEPTVMETLEKRYPEIASANKRARERVGEVLDSAAGNLQPFIGNGQDTAMSPSLQQPWPAQGPLPANSASPAIGPHDWLPPSGSLPPQNFQQPVEQPTIRREYGTAQRPNWPFD